MQQVQLVNKIVSFKTNVVAPYTT